MDPESPTGGARPGFFRRWQRWLLVLASLPFLAFGLSNLLLNSHWLLGRVAAKIQARTTLETRIGSASWSPWHGVTVRQIRVEQPAQLQSYISQPLLTLGEVRIQPIWRSWLQGRLEAKAIYLKSPHVVLPLELVSHFAPPPLSPAAVTAANSQPDSPTDKASDPAAAAAAASQTSPAAAPAASSQAKTPPAAAPPHAQKRTGYINLTDASFTLVFGSDKNPLLNTRGISGAIPVGGDAANSSLLIGSFDFIGQPSITNLHLPLRWLAPLITIGPTATEIAGLTTRIDGQLGMLNGLPLTFQAVAEPQPGKPITLGGRHTFQAAETSATLRFGGLLLGPTTWQGDFVAAATRPVVNFNGRETRFDHAKTTNVLRNGTLSCLDARLVGDEISLLGNGTLLSNGEVAAVLRVVAPQDTTNTVIQQLFPGLRVPPAYTPMATPQRVALDLEAAGSLGNLQIRLGKNGPLVGAPNPPATAPPSSPSPP